MVGALLSLLPLLPGSRSPPAVAAAAEAAAAQAAHWGTEGSPAVVWGFGGSHGGPEGQRLLQTTNAVQGLLQQLEALLMHNVLPGEFLEGF